MRGQRNLQLAIDVGLNPTCLDVTQLKPKPNPEIELNMDIKNPARTLLLRIKHGKLIRSKQKQLLPFEHRTQNGRILVALVKRGKRLGAKPLAHIESVGFEAFVVNADLFVGVSDGDVESKIVVEHANVVVVGGAELIWVSDASVT
jgi:hypothetical protein